ncbi:RimJ/RimL family protein N-acetyltransferase [Chitinophaga skermanii]|uniref:RimJ/RimL family protein N-acetyltransferase n=1 Tax=Chitinophaga skermanii TaxID=331697 RepID=A0A327QQJ2_9BACT|nr:GNAT family protein [Chitinophaga skermanii]RAJ06610.1 RimJ/RimL family protein N-acetyltransferase [Chitinophaga skermanii]
MIQLAPFEEIDFNRLIAWLDTEELLVQVAGPLFTHPLNTAQLVTYIADPNRHAFKVIDTTSHTVIGHAEIYKTEDNTGKICRVVIGDTTLRGKGIGQALISALVAYAVEDLQLQAVELNVYDWNTAAIKCYEKVGFVFNPNKMATIVVNGETWISLNMVYMKH